MEAVDFKYKVSFYKGMQMVFETLVLLILMVSIVLKSNVISIVYLLFIVKYIYSPSKTKLILHMIYFVSIAFSAQYIMYVMNLTHHTSPLNYPEQFKNYPYNGITYAFPFFFKFKVFHDLKLTYLVGIGFEKSQVFNLILDFFNMYIISMYILHYRNPILVKSMRKVFWRFPSMFEDSEKWDRLDHMVKKQVNWLYDPLKIDRYCLVYPDGEKVTY